MLRHIILLSLALVWSFSHAGPVARECKSDSTACAPNSFCFQSSQNDSSCEKTCQKDWKCNNGDVSCTIPLQQMIKEVSDLKHGDVINGFAVNQLCIAKYACENKQTMDNPSWIEDILMAFVKPYVERTGSWKSVIDHCHSTLSKIPILGKYLCEEKMAEYHISYDLKNALSNHGCGTERDWQTVATYIINCVKQAEIGIPFGETYAISEVIRLRNTARESCIKTRRENGVQIEF